MGVGSAKRAAAKAQDKGSDSGRASTPVRAHRAASRAPKSGDSPFTTPKSSAKKASGFTSKLPTDQQRRSNGRQTGRNLIMWSRPRMAEKLLLHIHYECSRHKIQLPWNEIAHRLHPGSSGQAILQHINRLRKDVQIEGHMVPPVPTRPASGRPQNNKIRGYVLDEDCEEGVRPIYFDEHLEDRKFSIPGAYVDNYDDVDAELKANMNPPELFVKAESPLSPTPVRRKHSLADVGRREMKDSPYGKKQAHHEGTYPNPPRAEPVLALNDRILGGDDNMYHSPEAALGHGPDSQSGFPSASRDDVSSGNATNYAYASYRPAPMSAGRPGHPAFTQANDPFFGTEPPRQSTFEQAMNFDFGLPNIMNNLFSMPAVPYGDTSPMACQPEQMGRAETLSSSGSHSQSSGASVDDLAKSFPEASGGFVKPVDLRKMPNSA